MPENDAVIIRPRRGPLGSVALLAPAAAFVGFCLFPLYIVLTTSLKNGAQIAAWPPLWVFEPTFKNIQDAIFVSGGRSSLTFAINSVVITAASTIVALVLGGMAAYGLARFRFPGSRDVAFFILSTRFAPAVAFVIPVYVIVQKAGLLDTWLALIIIYTAANIPFVTWLLRGLLRGDPARDRRSRAGRRIFAYPNLLARGRAADPPGDHHDGDPDRRLLVERVPLRDDPDAEPAATLPVYLSQFSGSTYPVWDQYMAVGLVAIVPILIVTFWLQKHLVRGMTFGAVR